MQSTGLKLSPLDMLMTRHGFALTENTQTSMTFEHPTGAKIEIFHVDHSWRSADGLKYGHSSLAQYLGRHFTAT